MHVAVTLGQWVILLINIDRDLATSVGICRIVTLLSPRLVRDASRKILPVNNLVAEVAHPNEYTLQCATENKDC
jgi:hypothetical protein